MRATYKIKLSRKIAFRKLECIHRNPNRNDQKHRAKYVETVEKSVQREYVDRRQNSANTANDTEQEDSELSGVIPVGFWRGHKVDEQRSSGEREHIIHNARSLVAVQTVIVNRQYAPKNHSSDSSMIEFHQAMAGLPRVAHESMKDRTHPKSDHH
eukprot:62301_1